MWVKWLQVDDGFPGDTAESFLEVLRLETNKSERRHRLSLNLCRGLLATNFYFFLHSSSQLKLSDLDFLTIGKYEGLFQTDEL